MNVRTLCLGILYFGEATGYEIRKLAAEGCFSHFIEASYGSIYPALTKLTLEGLIVWREEATPGKPARKIYSLTPEGHTALIAALYEPPRGDVFKSEFLFQTMAAELIDDDHLQQLLADRIALLEEDLAHLCTECETAESPGSRFAVGYGVALTRAALDHLTIEGPKLIAATQKQRTAAE